jgi:hypothetical protein
MAVLLFSVGGCLRELRIAEVVRRCRRREGEQEGGNESASKQKTFLALHLVSSLRPHA